MAAPTPIPTGARRCRATHVRDITADPHTLVVSYRVRFDNFGSGKRPTVLKLVYRDGRYFIDGETTQGA